MNPSDFDLQPPLTLQVIKSQYDFRCGEVRLARPCRKLRRCGKVDCALFFESRDPNPATVKDPSSSCEDVPYLQGAQIHTLHSKEGLLNRDKSLLGLPLIHNDPERSSTPSPPSCSSSCEQCLSGCVIRLQVTQATHLISHCYGRCTVLYYAESNEA